MKQQNLRSAFNTRQYMLSKDFEIYYYSDTNPPSVSAHAHDYYEFYLFLEGRAQMDIRGTATPLQPGDLVLIPPGVMHHALTAHDGTPYRRFVFWVSRAYAGKLLDESPDYIFLMQQAAIGRSIWHLDAAERNTAQTRILALLEEIHLDRYGKSAAVSLGVNGLILWLNRTIYEREHPRLEAKGADLVDNLIAWLDQHASEEITLDQLADTFYVSKYYLAHSFKETLGVSIHQYIMKKRLAAARDAILSGTPIARACLDCGFRDYAGFFRAFRREYGLSPREYADTARQKL